ncbi:unnamed protein product, partial [Brenthis ino]
MQIVQDGIRGNISKHERPEGGGGGALRARTLVLLHTTLIIPDCQIFGCFTVSNTRLYTDCQKGAPHFVFVDLSFCSRRADGLEKF